MINRQETWPDDRFQTVDNDVWEKSHPGLSKELGRQDAFEKGVDTRRTMGGVAVSVNHFRLPDDRTGKKDGSPPKHRAED